MPERLAEFIEGHEVSTARAFFRRTDIDDGPLLDQIADHFDLLVTVDKNLRFQQNLRGRSLRIILLRAHSNAIEHLVPLVPGLLRTAREMQPGDLRVVGV